MGYSSRRSREVRYYYILCGRAWPLAGRARHWWEIMACIAANQMAKEGIAVNETFSFEQLETGSIPVRKVCPLLPERFSDNRGNLEEGSK